MKEKWLAALRFVGARVDAAVAAIEDGDYNQAEDEIRDAEARLRVLASEAK